MLFGERLNRAVERTDSLLCVGLDPQPSRTPPDDIFAFNRRVVDATRDDAAAYKPQSAFYEAAGLVGWQALIDTIELIRERAPDALIILDAKRGDIAHTAQAYAQAAFDIVGADAVTASPYLGGDSVAPFLERPDRGAFVLCRTSNAGGADLQGLPVAPDGDGETEPLYLRVAERVAAWGGAHGNAGLVVGATWPSELTAVRERCPDLPILLPGIGAQGGDLAAALRAGLDADGAGLLVSASRSLIYAGGPEEIGAEAEHLRRAINNERAALERHRGG